LSEPAQPVPVHLRIDGNVQGVGYRWSLKREAESQGVAGWVRNRPDGSVEAVLHGPTSAVNAVVQWARLGPQGAWVRSVEVEPVGEVEPLVGFEIRR
jgi:acylphosphatase